MIRRWIVWILILSGVWILVGRFTEVEALAETLRRGRWEWVLAAALLQVLYYLSCTALYQNAFQSVGVPGRVRELLPVWFASLFVNVAAPTTGPATFVDDAARRGHSAARAAAGVLLVRVADFGTFGLILIAGLVYLFLHHDLRAYQVLGAVLLLTIVAGTAAVLMLGLWQPDRLRRFLQWLLRTLNSLAGRFGRPEPLKPDWADRNVAEFTEAALAIAAHPAGLTRTLGLALAAHLLDLASLFTLFLAFRHPVGLGTLTAGFAVGVLFWIVSITPEGIGVVEGVMALVYTSLGVPADTATVVAVAFRGLTFWLPLAIGFLLLRRSLRLTPERSHSERRVPSSHRDGPLRTTLGRESFSAAERSRAGVASVRAAALLTALMGGINALSALTPSLPARAALLTRYSPVQVRHEGHLAATLAGFALMLLAGGLWRRKRTAWLLALVVLTVSIASHLLKGLDYEEATVATALALWLWVFRAQFHARSDPPSVRQGLRVLAGALAFTFAYGIMGFYLLDRHFSVTFSFQAAVRQTVTMVTQFYDPGLQPLTGFGRYFAGSIYTVGAVTLGYALLMLIRPVLVRQPATPDERRRARTIVESYGRSSLARFTLFDDKSYYFNPGGSVVAFVVKGRTAVALGDPIGPSGDAAATIVGYRDYCAGNDWHPAFYQTLPDYLDLYRAAALDTLCIGHEAIVDLGAFTLEGRAGKALRAAVNRLTRLGHRAEFYVPPLSDPLLQELRTVSDEWLAAMHGSEKRFSLGWFDDDYLRGCPVMAVHTPAGAISAFANLIPEYQRSESTIDLMRHRRGVVNGTMDFLFVSLFQWAREEGYATFSLGLSPLAGVGEQTGDPVVERVLHYIFEHIDRFYNFKGLQAFKAKFGPSWSPRYLVYPGPASLPTVAMAVIRADAGDDFIWRTLKG
jgi:phosphatidylglycerol lysyltransferase